MHAGFSGRYELWQASQTSTCTSARIVVLRPATRNRTWWVTMLTRAHRNALRLNDTVLRCVCTSLRSVTLVYRPPCTRVAGTRPSSSSNSSVGSPLTPSSRRPPAAVAAKVRAWRRRIGLRSRRGRRDPDPPSPPEAKAVGRSPGRVASAPHRSTLARIRSPAW